MSVPTPQFYPRCKPRRLVGIATTAVLTALCTVAIANPNGAQVVSGTASMTNAGGQLSIKASDGTIINWRDFSIRSGESTRFIQPGSQARVLNRVTGSMKSMINGDLLANGQVYLINRNGVVFGSGSVVDTAGLVASTLDMSNEDFLKGSHRFSGTGAGDLVNRGYIRTSGTGDVVLIAPSVTNQGVIETQQGDLLLAAGESVFLQSLDVEHVSFEVSAKQGEVVNLGKLLTNDGAIGLFAKRLTVGGEAIANRIKRDGSGRIQLVAAETNEVTGLIQAGGDDGVIIIDGAHTTVGKQASVIAQSGGSVSVNGQRSLSIDGQLVAHDGLIKTSSDGGLRVSRAPTTGSGEWVLDSRDINIVEGSVDNDPDKPIALVGTDVIYDGLNKSKSVTIKTDGAKGKGNIRVATKISHSGRGTLGLIAANDIIVGQDIDTKNVDVTLDAGNSVRVEGDITSQTLTVNSSVASISGASVNTSGDVAINAGDITVSRGQIQSAKRVRLNGTGTVSIRGLAPSSVSGSSVNIKAGSDISINGQQITISEGSHLDSQSNIAIKGSERITLASGDTPIKIAAANQVTLDAKVVVVSVPKKFEGTIVDAPLIDVPNKRLNCTDCSFSEIVNGKVTGIDSTTTLVGDPDPNDGGLIDDSNGSDDDQDPDGKGGAPRPSASDDPVKPKPSDTADTVDPNNDDNGSKPGDVAGGSAGGNPDNKNPPKSDQVDTDVAPPSDKDTTPIAGQDQQPDEKPDQQPTDSAPDKTADGGDSADEPTDAGAADPTAPTDEDPGANEEPEEDEDTAPTQVADEESSSTEETSPSRQCT